MPDILNVDVNSATSSYTKMRVTSYSAVPRTDAVGTRVTLGLRLITSSATSLGSSSTDQSYGRVFVGTFNGYDIGRHIIKQYNNPAHNWVASTTYTWTITFDVPYSPGTPYCNFRVEPQGEGSYMTTSTFTWGTNVYTMTSGAVTACAGVTSLTIDNIAQVQKGTMTGTHTLRWSGATGYRTLEYVIFYTHHLSGGWVYLTTVSGTSLVVDAAAWNVISRGYSVSFVVRAQDGYTYADVATWNTIRLVNLPGAPDWTGIPQTAKFNAPLTIDWGEGTFGGIPNEDGTLLKYIVQVRRKAKGTSTWSGWVDVAYPTTETLSTTPSTYTAWTVRPGDTLQYRIYTVSSYNLSSATGTETLEVLMKGGTCRIRVAGVWKEGIAWVRVAGVWKEASSVYQRVAGIWRESV